MEATTLQSPANYLDYKEEMHLRMQHYYQHPDLISLFLNAYQLDPKAFNEAAQVLELDLFDESGKFRDIHALTLTQIEDIAREMDLCGYGFLEMGQEEEELRFYNYIPMRYQPYLDELFELAFHRELETIQYYIQDFVQKSQLFFEELNAIDFGQMEVSLSISEKVSQGLYIPAFELIKREYLLFAAGKIKLYNPHRSFHRLYDLSEEDKYKIMQYVHYIVQGDQVLTAGEMAFVDNLLDKLRVKEFDANQYRNLLAEDIPTEQLTPLSLTIPEAIRRQVLGLVIDCAYSDKMLHTAESVRILTVTKLILGDASPLEE